MEQAEHDRLPVGDERIGERQISAPPGNARPPLARDHAAPGTTLVLAKAISLGRGRVRPLAWCSRPRSWTASPAGALITADRHLERWVVHHRVGWLDWLFVFLSWIGTDGVVLLVV